MAGGSRSGDDDDLITDINVTPLVDVVLVLLIIFMVIVPLTLGLILVLLYINFRNLTEALMVMLVLPLALVGGRQQIEHRPRVGEVVGQHRDLRAGLADRRHLRDGRRHQGLLRTTRRRRPLRRASPEEVTLR